MRYDFGGFWNLLYYRGTLGFNEIINYNKIIFILVAKKYLRSILAYFRWGSLLFNSNFSDVTGLEQQKFLFNSQISVLISYIFYSSWWGYRIIVMGGGCCWNYFSNISEFFGGGKWPERELGEMLGVNFRGKLDGRRLLLDYSLEGYPLLREFPTMGFKELSYCSLERWVKYEILFKLV